MPSKIKQLTSFETLLLSDFQWDYYSLNYPEIANNLTKIGIKVRKFKNLELKAS